jgi:hypothetical protein
MTGKIYLIVMSILSSSVAEAQNDKNNQPNSDTLLIKSTSIDKMITLKQNDKAQQALLVEFKNKYQKNDTISVEEFQNCYQLIVNHPDQGEYTGGVECYQLDKKSGATKMIWHEHPMPLPDD